jgi:hypothetical protein
LSFWFVIPEGDLYCLFVCHPRRGSALSFWFVIPEGDLRLSLLLLLLLR